MRRPHLCLAFLGTLALHGCAAPPPPPPPVVSLACGSIPGPPLAGAVRPGSGPRAAAAGAPRLLAATCRLAEAPPRTGAALAARTRVAVRLAAPAPFAGLPGILPGLRIVSGAAAQDWRQELEAAPRLADGTAVLVPGASARLSLRVAPRETPAATFLVGGGDGGAACALDGQTRDGNDEQVLLADELQPGGTPLGFYLPLAERRGLAVFLQIPALPPEAEAVAAAERELAAAQAAAPARAADAAAPRTAGPDPVLPAVLAAVLDPGSRPAPRRAALLWLCEHFGARRAADLALAGDDGVLATVAAALPADLPLRPRDGGALALELAALRTVLPRLHGDGDAPELQAWAFRHAGVARSSPASLLHALEGCATTEALQAAIVHWNRDTLGSEDPALRVRACDWLAAQGIVVPGFDPLQPREQRRAALEAAGERQ